MKTGRRSFIKTIGSLTILFAIDPAGVMASPDEIVLPGILRRSPATQAWLQVLANGRVRVFTGKMELGQGLCGAVTQAVAEELDLLPSQVEVVFADTLQTPNEGFTGASSSTETSVLATRYAAAAARKELLDLAAEKLSTDAALLSIQAGVVRAKQDNRSINFYELLDGKQLQSEVKLPLTLKPKSSYTISGKAIPREDIREMVTGDQLYVHNMRLPGMVHARTIHPPSYNARFMELDEKAVRDETPGILKIVRNGSFVAVVCDDEYQAVKAQRSLQELIKWSEVKIPSSADNQTVYLRSLTTESRNVKASPVPFPTDSVSLKASYSKGYIMHGSIGPSCAVALFENGKLRVWTHSQGAFPVRDTLSKMLKLDATNIEVTCVRGAGGYGQNGAEDAAVEAALIAVEYSGKPIRLQWMREDEHGWEPYATAMSMDLEAVMDSDGKITHFKNDVWSDTHYIRGNPEYLTVANNLGQSYPRKRNPVSSGGYRNADLYYDVANQTINAHFFIGPLYTANLRSLGAYANLFAVESFIDELATKAAIDPFTFRENHLKDDRAKVVLGRLKEQATSWKKTEHQGLGIAFSRYKNTGAYCAVAAQVFVDPETNDCKIHKLLAVADAGEIISLDSVKSQLEGGMIQAASWTLYESIQYEGETITSRNWTSYPIIRFDAIPETEAIVITRPNEKLEGVGEIAMGPTAAAITNAIAAACSRRIRNLPVGNQLKER